METTLPKLVEMFVAAKQAEGKTAKTVKWYREMLGRFVAFAGPETTIKELSVPASTQPWYAAITELVHCPDSLARIVRIELETELYQPNSLE